MLIRPTEMEAIRAGRIDIAFRRWERARLVGRLDRMDQATSHGPWTRATLASKERRPAIRAPDLGEEPGRESAPFKRDVRRLKAVGLTESLEVGYRLSPRGSALLRGPGDARSPVDHEPPSADEDRP